jgi:hypothetical protein
MLPASLKFNKNILTIAVLAVFTFGGGFLLMNGVAISHRDKVATGFLFDLLITFPLCYYFIIIRPLRKSGRGIFLVLTVCCGIAYLVLPTHQRGIILQIRKLSALAELAFIIYAITKIRKIRLAYKTHQLGFADPVFSLRNAMSDLMGDRLPVKVLAAELAVWRYGVLFWKAERTLSKEVKPFSTHKESGYVAIWCILLVAVLVEVVAFHFLLMRWSRVAADIVSVLTLYSIIFFIADLSAVIKRQVLIDGETIVLRTGLRWRTIVEKSNIESVIKIKNGYDDSEIYLKGAVMKAGANVFITFKSPVAVDKLYGPAKQFKSVLMSIDNADDFIAQLNL